MNQELKLEDRMIEGTTLIKNQSDLLLYAGVGLYILLNDIKGVNRIDNIRLDSVLSHNIQYLRESDYIKVIAEKPEKKEELLRFLEDYAQLTKAYMEFLRKALEDA